MKKLLPIFFLSLATSPATQAADSHSGCEHLHIQISNLTKVACVLTSEKVNHGNLISAPPTTLMVNESKVFDMEQTIYGPNATLSYQCGEENITITSQQNLCFMGSGKITGTVLPPLPENIEVSYTVISGSYIWDKPGIINWKFLAKS